MQLLNRADYFAIGRRYIRGRPSTRINPDLVDVDGSDVNLQVGSASLMAEALSAQQARCLRGLFFRTARGQQLDELAADRLGLKRKAEAQATVDLALARPTAAGGTGTVDAGFRTQTADGTAYALDTDVVFGAGVLSMPATATAILAGPEGNVAAGQIVSFLDQPFDPTIVPSNAEPAAGGAAVESDAAFLGRIFGFFATIRRGVLGAIEFAATLVPGVAVATATDIDNPGTGLPGGAVQLVAGDADGNATSDMLQAIRDKLLEYRAGGIPVILSAGVVVPEDVIWDLDYKTGVDTARAQASVRAVTVALTKFLAAGAPLMRGTLISGALSVPGVIVRQDSLVEPAGDVYPEDRSHLIRVRPTGVSFL